MQNDKNIQRRSSYARQQISAEKFDSGIFAGASVLFVLSGGGPEDRHSTKGAI